MPKSFDSPIEMRCDIQFANGGIEVDTAVRRCPNHRNRADAVHTPDAGNDRKLAGKFADPRQNLRIERRIALDSNDQYLVAAEFDETLLIDLPGRITPIQETRGRVVDFEANDSERRDGRNESPDQEHEARTSDRRAGQTLEPVARAHSALSGQESAPFRRYHDRLRRLAELQFDTVYSESCALDQSRELGWIPELESPLLLEIENFGGVVQEITR